MTASYVIRYYAGDYAKIAAFYTAAYQVWGYLSLHGKQSPILASICNALDTWMLTHVDDAMYPGKE